MKYRINLLPYNYYIKLPDDKKPGEMKESVKTCNVQEMIFNVILNPRLQHNGMRFYTIAKTANRIKNCKEDTILLDNTEYFIVKDCFENTTGFGSNDIELVNRVYEAVKVEEK